MIYFKINDTDFSKCVSGLNVKKSHNYNAQVNAAGNSTIDYINSKLTIGVDIIPLDNADMKNLQTAIGNFNVMISFMNPETNTLKTIDCIVSENETQFYTIQDSKVMYNAYHLDFTEL